jgi:hypothetical protein
LQGLFRGGLLPAVVAATAAQVPVAVFLVLPAAAATCTVQQQLLLGQPLASLRLATLLLLA